MNPRQVAPVAFVALVACTGAREPRAGADTPPAERTSPEPAPTTAVAPQPDPAGKPSDPADAAFGEAHGGQTVTVAVGDRFDVGLGQQRNPPDGEPPWGEPQVEGDAIAHVVRWVEAPPPDVDGGSFRIFWRFEARAAGDATITIARSPADAPYILRVHVEQ